MFRLTFLPRCRLIYKMFKDTRGNETPQYENEIHTSFLFILYNILFVSLCKINERMSSNSEESKFSPPEIVKENET